MKDKNWILKVNKTKIIIKIILIGLAIAYLSSCTQVYHPSNPKLHNIQVIKNERHGSDCRYIYYFSFKDSSFDHCYVYNMFEDSFKVSVIRK